MKVPGLQITAKVSEYMGRPLLTLTSGHNERYPFSFGLQKAKRVLACIPDIQRFVAAAELAVEREKLKKAKLK